MICGRSLQCTARTGKGPGLFAVGPLFWRLSGPADCPTSAVFTDSGWFSGAGEGVVKLPVTSIKTSCGSIMSYKEPFASDHWDQRQMYKKVVGQSVHPALFQWELIYTELTGIHNSCTPDRLRVLTGPAVMMLAGFLLLLLLAGKVSLILTVSLMLQISTNLTVNSFQWS